MSLSGSYPPHPLGKIRGQLSSPEQASLPSSGVEGYTSAIRRQPYIEQGRAPDPEARPRCSPLLLRQITEVRDLMRRKPAPLPSQVPLPMLGCKVHPTSRIWSVPPFAGLKQSAPRAPRSHGVSWGLMALRAAICAWLCGWRPETRTHLRVSPPDSPAPLTNTNAENRGRGKKGAEAVPFARRSEQCVLRRV